MMARTINGKSFDEIIKELSAPFDVSDFQKNIFDFFYLPVEKYQQRLDEVVGILNYDFVTTKPQTCIIGTVPHISLCGTITLRDDDGNPVCSKSACGGAPVILKSKDNEAAAYKNDLETATQDVFKRCCKKLGIAEAQLKSLRQKNDEIDPEQPVSLYLVRLREAFSSLKNRNNYGYSAIVDIKGEKEPRRLVLFKSAIEQIERFVPIGDFIKNYGPNSELYLYGRLITFNKKNGDKELQLIMERPYVEERS